MVDRRVLSSGFLSAPTESAITDASNGFVQTLPVELASALRQTTAETFASLLSLRIALRDYVRAERSEGATLSDIDGELRQMIVVAGGDPAGVSYSEERMGELTTHVLKWSQTFYTGRVR